MPLTLDELKGVQEEAMAEGRRAADAEWARRQSEWHDEREVLRRRCEQLERAE